MAAEWEDSKKLALRALQTGPSPWMRETTMNNLQILGATMEAADQSRIREFLDWYRSAEREGTNA